MVVKVRLHKMSDSLEVIQTKLEKMISKGYDYNKGELSEIFYLSDVLIVTPSKNVWGLDGCLKSLSKGLEFGNLEQIESINSLEIINLIYNLYPLVINLDRLEYRELIR